MSHKAIRELIQDTVKSLADNITFSYGRTSDFNQEKKPSGTLVNLDLLSSTPQFAVDGVLNYVKTWNCSMAFYKYDRAESIASDYAKILDDTDLLVDRFINALNTYSHLSDGITVADMNEEPFIKATSAILTGHLISFTILQEDTFDYCAIDCRLSDPNDC